MKKLDKIGPSTEPCGTPDTTFLKENYLNYLSGQIFDVLNRNE